jgi:hypothetical protein
MPLPGRIQKLNHLIWRNVIKRNAFAHDQTLSKEPTREHEVYVGVSRRSCPINGRRASGVASASASGRSCDGARRRKKGGRVARARDFRVIA